MRDIFLYTDQGVVVPNTGDMLCEEWIAFERAAKLEAQRLIISYGGGAANAAVTFARLGLRPSIITAVGGDATGLDCILHLRREGVSLKSVQRAHREQTGTAFILNVPDKMSQVALVYRGASAKLHLSSATTKTITTPWVYLTALGGNWKQSLDAVMARVEQRSIMLAWNPGAEQIAAGIKTLAKYIRKTQVFMVNHDEALELAKSANLVAGPTAPRSLVKLLGRYGARYTVVTDGHKGAFVYSDKKTLYQPAKIGKIANKTGAGDAFGSGLVAGLIRFKDIKRALKLAMHNSHSVVGHIGAQTGILYTKDIHRLKI